MADPSERDCSSSRPFRRAPVVPRVRAWPDGEVLPLEHHIQRFLDQGAPGTVNVFGPPGSGKSMALKHLSAVFPPRSLRLLDDLPPDRVFAYGRDLPIIYTTIERCTHALLALEMAAWEEDDLTEYLLHAHPQQCKSVMARVHADGGDGLGGVPELWAAVLDELASDESVADISTALRRYLTRQLADPETYAQAIRRCMQSLDLGCAHETPATIEQPPTRLLRHRLVSVLLASEKLATDIAGGRLEMLAGTRPPDLVSESGRKVEMRPKALPPDLGLVTE